MRWALALLLILVGIGMAGFEAFVLAFGSAGCTRSEGYAALPSVLTLAALVVPAVLLIRRSKAMHVLVALVVGALLIIAGCGAFAVAFDRC